MQTMFGTFVLALGFLVGGLISGWIGDEFVISGEGADVVRDWTKIWLSCAAIAGSCVILLILFFPSRIPADVAEVPSN